MIESKSYSKKKSQILDILMYLFTLTVVIGIVYSTGALTGFPKGHDAYCHVYRIGYILKHFPHHNWNYQWDFGVPLFEGSYPPMSTLLGACFSGITGYSPEDSLNTLSVLSYCLCSIGLLGFIYSETKNRLGAILSITLLNLSPGYWSTWLDIGLYARVISLGFFGLSLYLVSRVKKKNNSFTTLALTITLSLALTSHLLGGFLALSMITIFILMQEKNLSENLKQFIIIFVLVTGLSSYYIAQYLFTNPTAGGVLIGGVDYDPAPLQDLISPSTASIHPLILPILLSELLIIFKRYVRRKNDIRNIFSKQRSGLMSSFFLAFISIGYAFIGYFPSYPRNLYIWGFWPQMAFSIIPIGLTLLIGLLFPFIDPFKNKGILNRVFSWSNNGIYLALIIISSLLGGLFILPVMRTGVYDASHFPPMDLITIESENKLQRLGSDSPAVAIWFNHWYEVPQNRDFYAQGVPYPSWNYWQVYSIWDKYDNYEETNYLLDWYAIRWIVTDRAQDKFLKEPQFYKLINNDGIWYQFEYNEATEILVASNTPVAAFIGSESAYRIFLESLSQTNYNSQNLILIKGGETIEDAKDILSRQFDLVILYGYDYTSQEEAFPLLRTYVEKGGNLLLLTDLSKDSTRSFLPDPSPIWSTEGMSFGTEWNFTYPSSEYTENIDFTKFSNAVYSGMPWGYSGTKKVDVKEGSREILYNHGYPVVVEKKQGKGNVIWCGLNLPYHIISYQNREESLFLVKLIEGMTSLVQIEPEFTAERINPELTQVKIDSPAKGVLFKESFFSEWRARLRGKNTYRLKIYRAGPDLMYVQLPPWTGAITLELYYEKLLVLKIGESISLLTLLSIIFYTFNRILKGKYKF